MRFTKVRLCSIVLICVISLLFTFGNFYKIGIFSYNKIRLGLDLRGGIQIQLKVDYDIYFKEKLEKVIVDLKNNFRIEKIKIIPKLNSDNNTDSIFVANGKDNFEKIKKILSNIDNGLLVKVFNNDIIIEYGTDSIDYIKSTLLKKSMEIIERRINEIGIKEAIIQAQGNDKILVQISRLENVESLKNILGRTAKMTFHLVNTNINDKNNIPNNLVKLKDRKNYEWYVEKESLLSGEVLEDASVTFNQGKSAVMFKFNSIGTKKFADITKKNQQKILAVVIDNEVITTPRINTIIFDGKGVISGSFTTKEANELATLLKSGSLPTKLNVVEEATIAPLLGNNVNSGLKACIFAFVFVILFMIYMYRYFGVLVDLVAILSLIIIFAILSIFNITLTLSGIFGFVLAILMTVNTNIVIFERIKDEYKNTKKIYSSVEDGFNSVWSAIFNFNIVNLLVSFVLYVFGNPIINNFITVFTVGIFVSLFFGVELIKFLSLVLLKLINLKRI